MAIFALVSPHANCMEKKRSMHDLAKTEKCKKTKQEKRSINDLEEFASYLKRTNNVNEIDRIHGMTMLHCAAMENQIEKLQLLLAHPQCNVNAKSFAIDTPLHFAIKYERVEIAKILIAHPCCDVNALTYDKWSPLYTAIRHKQPEIVALLLARPECNVHIQCIMGWSPLTFAAHTKQIEIVKLLLAHREPDQKNKAVQACKGDKTTYFSLFPNDIINFLCRQYCTFYSISDSQAKQVTGKQYVKKEIKELIIDQLKARNSR